jgi:hypothetical protein
MVGAVTRQAAITLAGLLLGLMVWAPFAIAGGNGIGSGGLNGFPPPSNAPATFAILDGGPISTTQLTATYALIGNEDAGFVMVDTLGLRGGGAIFHSGGFEQHNLDVRLNTGLGVFSDYLIATSTKPLILYGEKATSGTTVAITLNSDPVLGAGDKIVSIQNNEVEKAYFDQLGGFTSLDSVSAPIVHASGTLSAGACTLNGGTPSTCTATTVAGYKCTCAPVGTTAAIALGGCAVSLSGSTLTVTGPNAATNDVNYHCL